MNEINRIYLKWFAFLTVVVFAIALLFFFSYKDVKDMALVDFNRHQMMLADQTVSGIENMINSLSADLEFIAGFDDVALMNTHGKRILSDLLKKRAGLLISVGRFDSRGRIVWLDPPNKKLIGTDVSSQSHVKYVLENHKPYVSDVFMAVQGFYSIAYHQPVFYNGVFRGSIGVLINFDYISRKYIEKIEIGDSGYAWVISENGTELYCPVPGHQGKTVFQTSKDFPDIISMAKRMMKGERGVTTYRFDRVKSDFNDPILKHAVFAPISIVNTKWSIVVATPEEHILAPVRGFRNKLVVILLLILGISAVFYYFLFRVWAYVAEVRDKVRVETALKRNEENLRNTLNSIGDAVISTDREGRVKRVNPMAENITGWSAGAAEGRQISEIFDISDNIKGLTGETLHERLVQPNSVFEVSDTVELLDRKGLKKRISMTASPITNLTGENVGAVIIFRDISDRLRIEEQLRQSQKMDLIGRLTGGIAHDFNNMLAGILSASEVLELKFGGDEKSGKFITFIKETAIKASGLTRKLLNFSHKGMKTRENVDVHSSIKLAVDILHHTLPPNINIIKALEAERSVVSGDPSQLQSMVLNLVINARDAMPEGGAVEIKTINVIISDDNPLKTGFGIDPGMFVKLSVCDTGSGIDDELKTKIFDPFFSTKSEGEGVGLGLSIVYGNVKDHGGAIEIRDGAEGGACFEIYLPVQELASHEHVIDDEIVSGKGTVFVVEDEFVLRTITESVLTDLGYKVYTAGDGAAGLDFFKKHYGEIDVVLMDVVMPVMGGLDALREFNSVDPDAVVYLITGNTESIKIDSGDETGAAGILQKPVTIPELSRIVAEGVEKKQSSQPGSST